MDRIPAVGTEQAADYGTARAAKKARKAAGKAAAGPVCRPAGAKILAATVFFPPYLASFRDLDDIRRDYYSHAEYVGNLQDKSTRQFIGAEFGDGAAAFSHRASRIPTWLRCGNHRTCMVKMQ
ncbi:MAG: hypothetical protein LBT40_13370 [Deltaproteobacteria bacterium]|nr:hypothetical protein [Deltaproteobacteria bacterium]